MSSIPPTARFARVVVVHGFGATSRDHWFPWLATVLPAADVLSLPDPVHPDAAVWVPAIAEAVGHLSADTAVVTHSLGGIAAVRAVERLAARESGNL